MLTINDFSLMDDTWKGTISCGYVGAEILKTLKKAKVFLRGISILTWNGMLLMGNV
ncbi:TPA: hypothetical protein ACS50C_004685 [Salmonella enterica]